MSSLSKVLSNMIFTDLMENTTIPKKEIYNKQVKKDKLLNIFIKIKMPLFLATIFYFILNPSMHNFLIMITITLLGICINVCLEENLYEDIKKHFTIEKRILSLKKNIIKILDDKDLYKKSTIEEANALLKIIDNTKEIKKIIRNTNYLSKQRFYKYIKNSKGNSVVVNDLIKNKSIKEEYNLEKIRKEINQC